MSNNSPKPRFVGDGIVTFQDVPAALKAEKLLKSSGYETKLVAPPPSLRMGCDLGLEILLAQRPAIEALLKERDVPYSRIIPL